MVNQVIIYSKTVCPFCVRAKQWLTEHGLTCTEINIEDSAELREEMMQKSGGRRTVPQIFINNCYIGGYDDLLEAEQSGLLKKVLRTEE